MTLLLVIWVIAGQQVHGYQERFSSASACREAREALVEEAARLNTEPPMTLADGSRLAPLPVRVSAICVAV